MTRLRKKNIEIKSKNYFLNVSDMVDKAKDLINHSSIILFVLNGTS